MLTNTNPLVHYPQSGSPLRVGYVLKRFPRLSETFILNELIELEHQGAQPEVVALLEPNEESRHALLSQMQAQVTYLPAKNVLRALPMREGSYAAGKFKELPLEKRWKTSEQSDTGILFLKAAVVAAHARARGLQHLHAHFGTDSTTVAMYASRLSGLPYSFTAHAKDIFDAGVDQDVLREKIRQAAFVVTVSDYNRRYLMELVGDDAAPKIIRLYNGIDLRRFATRPSSGHEPDLILAVGRLVEKKGFRYLIEACQLLRQQNRSFRCVLIGDGSEQESLANQIKERGLTAQVTLAGALPQEEVMQWLHKATVLVLPAVISASGDRDALPTVLLEAMSVGLPVISTKIVGIPEIVDNGEAGILVPPAAPAPLATAMEQVLDNPELQLRLSERGRRKTETTFDIQKNVAQLKALFQSAATGHDGFIKA